ncbi:hypothetical protein H6G11_05875 [Cyanobacterium aponinum FACHB-4101]|uniref:hypothetical protein n=1 Tax=Cyanobacterium aponinum TaxID=379064 RepID=UPI0002D9446A|nr:hypothetical protein [Cyanobacterium aponinum]MBD2393781.1 hypothetical protein [Cyanobacterium aponinum FACHB-4101]
MILLGFVSQPNLQRRCDRTCHKIKINDSYQQLPKYLHSLKWLRSIRCTEMLGCSLVY